jgi:hypothetical protein
MDRKALGFISVATLQRAQVFVRPLNPCAPDAIPVGASRARGLNTWKGTCGEAGLRAERPASSAE